MFTNIINLLIVMWPQELVSPLALEISGPDMDLHVRLADRSHPVPPAPARLVERSMDGDPPGSPVDLRVLPKLVCGC